MLVLFEQLARCLKHRVFRDFHSGGRRIEPSREQLVHVIGFVVVIGLMLVLTARELADVIGFGKP